MTEEVMTVRTERTPNPLSLKYNLNKMLLPGGSANFPTAKSAERSPLAVRLFAVDGVDAVFIGPDFFTITKKEASEWADLNAGIAPALEDFFESGDPVLQGQKPVDFIPELTDDDADPELVAQIKAILDEKVRPAVAQDGGDIVYRGFKEGVVYLEMHGACSGCPSASITLKDGIESLMTNAFPDDVKEVVAI